MNTDLTDLFTSAIDEGNFSQAAIQAINVTDIGAEIQAGFGVPADSIKASEVVLVSILVDDSSSIAYRNNQAPINEGFKTVVDALLKSKQSDGILLYVAYMNRGVVHPFGSISDQTKDVLNNYRADGSTPLYDSTVEMLATIVAKAQDLSDNGIACRGVTLLLTDGEDVGSRRKINQVADVVGSMLATEMHIIAAMGIGSTSSERQMFTDVFKRMGIPSNWIMTVDSNASEIRQAFTMFSQSAVRASQSTGTFSQTSLGGFGT